MDLQIIAIYFFADEILKTFRFQNDPQVKMTNAEVITFALIAARFSSLAEYFKRNNSSQEYAIDSFPIPVCDNIRIFRSKVFSGKVFRGYTASKKRYFYGIKSHLLVTSKGEPVECAFTPGSESDISAFKNFELDVPGDSVIYADKAYTCYDLEDFLKDVNISLIVQRKANSKRPLSGCLRYIQSRVRKKNRNYI